MSRAPAAAKPSLLYPLAYFFMLHVLRFVDAFQHTYEVDERLNQPRPAVLNLFMLNFGYHNSHHNKPGQPWFRLPTLQRERNGDGTGQSIPFANQLRAYHRFRTARRRVLLTTH